MVRMAGRVAWACALAAGVASAPAWAISTDEAEGRATQAIITVEADMARPPPESKLIQRPPTPAERIAAGDMLLRTKDYEQAIDTLSKVLELYRQGRAPETAFVDGSFLLAEAYFRSVQYLSARRHYRDILDNGARPSYLPYAGRALSRLVDIALKNGDLNSLDSVIAKLGQLPITDRTGSLPYARAKALFARGDLGGARASVRNVPANSEYLHQAEYLLGVIFTREAVLATNAAANVAPHASAGSVAAVPATTPGARFQPALDQFMRITRMQAATPEAREVLDLAWLALGRIYYEVGNYQEASEAYGHVERGSPQFPVMLYELAWVYVRLHDFPRARRALEVLAVTAPNNADLADGSLLRGDLMLRSGEFKPAFSVYKSVLATFDPILEKLSQFLDSTNDPAVYYDRLTGEDVAAGKEKLPALVLEWARDQARDQHIFGMIDDVGRSRELIRNSRKLAARLNAVLSVPTRVKAFPEIRNALQYNLTLLNRLAKARGTLADGLDEVAGRAGGELGKVREERRALMKRLGWLPSIEADFVRRDESGDRQWSHVSQTLQQIALESDRLSAVVNGLRRVLKESEQYGVSVDAASRERFRLEIEANERDIQTYQKKLDEYRERIDQGRAQIGFGDQRYVEDDQVRARFREVFARELSLVNQGQDTSAAATYAKAIEKLVNRADGAEGRLEAERLRYERQALEQANNLRAKIHQETMLIEAHSNRLEGLDQQARLLVGEIAMKNFALVRERLKNIVLRADVGIVQQAWEVREQQRLRVRNLQRERAREEQNLNDELREVLDDAEEDR